jgi:hypothetical protein
MKYIVYFTAFIWFAIFNYFRQNFFDHECTYYRRFKFRF